MNQIRKYRKALGLTQQELADALTSQGHNCSAKTVTNMELGYHFPRVNIALGLSKFFGVSVEEIFSENGAVNTPEPTASERLLDAISAFVDALKEEVRRE
jgi:transcriptional regulator with XRE-family HTH domain